MFNLGCLQEQSGTVNQTLSLPTKKTHHHWWKCPSRDSTAIDFHIPLSAELAQWTTGWLKYMQISVSTELWQRSICLLCFPYGSKWCTEPSGNRTTGIQLHRGGALQLQGQEDRRTTDLWDWKTGLLSGLPPECKRQFPKMSFIVLWLYPCK